MSVDKNSDLSVDQCSVEANSSCNVVQPLGDEDLAPRKAVRKHLPAVLWAMGLACVSIMEGYNIGLVGSVIVFHPFERKYGTWDAEKNKYLVDFAWQMGMMLAAALGGVIGALIGGTIIERFGARWTIIVTQAYLTGVIFITFFAPTMTVIVVGGVLNGLAWGAMATIGPIYASEICPTALRGYLINFSNVAWVFGTLIAAIVLQAEATVQTEWSYKIPFALQWIWPVPLALISYFAPDSPWWLIRHNRLDDAKESLKRLTRDPTPEAIEQQLEQMIRTNKYEKAKKTESNYRDCFRGTNLKRSEIAIVALCAQSVTGQGFLASPTYFFIQVGFGNQAAFDMNVGSTALAVVSNILCWFLMTRYGRRPLFIIGLIGTGTILLLIGILDSIHTKASLWAQGSLAIVWILFYQGFFTPEAYTIAGEISATRVRAETLSLARGIFGIVALAMGLIQTYLLNPTGVYIHGKCGYVWFGFTFITLVWAIFRAPETKGRSYEELDYLFDHHIPARKFKSCHVDVSNEMASK